ncbi:hypothetical protein [Frigidibacter sp. SD6-1]|uniref:hypothetical protein n=1 Tax=Frigidibacter sp. SD6-1 TaxID=3032581 RepID=UPI0024E014FD|nr:hypothetical protein [Frigidibacter sp. SD6-1]
MTVSEKDLLLAILSMDAYNRGYGAGIGDGVNVDAKGNDIDGLGQIGSTVGSARVINDDVSEAAQAAGFYAVAYDTPYGTVISYRGTDSTPLSDTNTDRIHGWGIGVGNFMREQARLASEFPDAVQDDTKPGSVIFTGHSLGGGIAA